MSRIVRSALIAMAFIAGLSQLDGLVSSANAQCPNGIHGDRHPVTCRPHEWGSPDLFYNFYVEPNCGAASASAYLAPHYVPAHVGHTYYTYQPFMPHELMYKHSRVYHRYYNEGRGKTRTSIRWW